MAIRSSMLAAIGVKAMVVGAVVALASGGAAAAMKATGDAHPANWGQHVVQTVKGCKLEARTGTKGQSQGIGDCVSDAAQEHGKHVGNQGVHDAATAAAATASATPMPGKRVGQESGATPASAHGQGQANGPAVGAARDQGADASGGQGAAKGHGQSSAPSPHV